MNETKSSKLQVHFDGGCPLCTVIVDGLEEGDTGGTFSFKDATTSELPSQFSRDEALKTVHVIDENGKVFVGIDAVIRVLEEYPRWKYLVMVMKLPVLHGICAGVYWVVARYRHIVPWHLVGIGSKKNELPKV